MPAGTLDARTEVDEEAARATPATTPYDVAVVGGGIVGTATAMALATHAGKRVVLLEAEAGLAAHQTGHNSGVVHSGLYYKPGSLKARLCVEGREAVYRFAEAHDIAHDRCGKVVVATGDAQVPAMEELARRGAANGLEGIQVLDEAGVRAREPHVRGVAGLFVPQTGIIDFPAVTRAYARTVLEHDGEIIAGARVGKVSRDSGGVVLETPKGAVHARHLIGCAGLQADRLARRSGVRPGLKIVPFRGEYFELAPARRDLVRNLIYPVPDPRFPFLGVHFTRMVHGGVEAGPNAVLALRREGYSKWSFALRDALSFALYGGFWRMAWRYWRTGLGEVWRSLSKRAFVGALRGLLPEITVRDVQPGGAGVRAQALEPSGALSDDFRFAEGDRMLHVLNAPSPAATASMAIGQEIVARAGRSFGWRLPS